MTFYKAITVRGCLCGEKLGENRRTVNTGSDSNGSCKDAFGRVLKIGVQSRDPALCSFCKWDVCLKLEGWEA
jgi:hypothetical protein